jgi:hypothetical protein
MSAETDAGADEVNRRKWVWATIEFARHDNEMRSEANKSLFERDAQVRFGRSDKRLSSRVARWYIFKPKIPIWVNFGGSFNGNCWHSLWTWSTDSTAIGYILWTFGIFCGNLVYFCRFGIRNAEKSGNPANVDPVAFEEPWWKNSPNLTFVHTCK